MLEVYGFHTADRASFAIARTSSFPVQTLGMESLSWLKTVVNLATTGNSVKFFSSDTKF